MYLAEAFDGLIPLSIYFHRSLIVVSIIIKCLLFGASDRNKKLNMSVQKQTCVSTT